MALKFKIDSLDGLDEGLKPLYAKGQDGKYTLQVDDSPATTALAKMKADLDAANTALNAASEEKARKEREAEESRARATGDFEKLKESLSSELKKEKERGDSLESMLRNGARDRAAMEAITAANGISKALLPHITGNLEVVPDGEEFRVVVKGNPGQKLSEYVAGLKEEMPWGFQASGMSGGGTQQHSGGKSSVGNENKSGSQLIAEGLRAGLLGKS